MGRSAAKPQIRCAIYTRKSSDEGLDQAFNSLDAQREACEAYVKSQAGEGWKTLPTAYDDGGVSGGTMDRPSLKRLLADVERGAIDVIVVYKVDRLTRSLTDFARMVEVFDRCGVSFVSVTQAFNTTSSMGRLTLNVLLSFAQFEREITGERIRDKIAASKAKGMWMGGMPPLGYDIPTDQTSRALTVNPAEAEVVRDIYRRYLQLKSVSALREALRRDGVVSKHWITRGGKERGGAPFSSGSLFHLLQSRIYLGDITHRGERHPGTHAAIVDPAMFEAVQRQMAANAVTRHANRPSQTRPLKGLLFNALGDRMTPAFAYGKNGKRHAYYVALAMQRAHKAPAGVISRVSAPALEKLLVSRLQALLATPETDWDVLCDLVRRIEVLNAGVMVDLDQASVLGLGDPTVALGRLQSRLEATDRLSCAPGEQTLKFFIATRPVFRGGRTWLVRPDGAASPALRKPDMQLIKALVQAHRALADHDAAPAQALEDWRGARAIADSYLRRLTSIAFLAPDVQRAILEGYQPAGLTAQQLCRQGFPLAWADQRRMFGLDG
jgi:site-specific DNA recombinase